MQRPRLPAAGKWHNRALGMSMRVEKSTADQVRQRLEEARRRKLKGEGPSAEDLAPDGEPAMHTPAMRCI